MVGYDLIKVGGAAQIIAITQIGHGDDVRPARQVRDGKAGRMPLLTLFVLIGPLVEEKTTLPVASAGNVAV